MMSFLFPQEQYISLHDTLVVGFEYVATDMTKGSFYNNWQQMNVQNPVTKTYPWQDEYEVCYMITNRYSVHLPLWTHVWPTYCRCLLLKLRIPIRLAQQLLQPLVSTNKNNNF